MTGLLTQYLGAGDLAERPTRPNIVAGALALYHAEDTGEIFKWNADLDPAEPDGESGGWQLFVVSDTPIDGIAYLRQDGKWVAYEAPEIPDSGIPDAPADGLYGRTQGEWQKIVIPEPPAPPVGEAPKDDKAYVRKNGEWSQQIDEVGIPEAPKDGEQYVRKDGAWAKVVIPDNPGGGGGEPDYASSTSFRFVIAAEGNYGRAFTGFGEVQLLDAGGVILSVPVTATATSSYDSNWTPPKAFDGNFNNGENGWLAESNKSLNEALIGTFPVAIKPTTLKLYPVYSYPESFPKKVRLEYNDNGEWKEVGTFDTANPVAGVAQTFELEKVVVPAPEPETIPEAPADGKTYGRKNKQWVEIVSGGGGGGGEGSRKRPKIIQFKGIRNDGVVRLPNPPTPGNTLVWVATGYGVSDQSYRPPNFNRAARFISNNNNSCTVDIGDTITAETPQEYNVSAGDNQQGVLYEIQDLDWIYPGSGGYTPYSGNDFTVPNPPSPYQPDALVFFAFGHDTMATFALKPDQPGVVADFVGSNENRTINHTGMIGHVEEGNPRTIRGNMVDGGPTDGVYGIFWALGSK